MTHIVSTANWLAVNLKMNGSRYRKKYDEPKTPYQRVLEEPLISQLQKDKLTALYQTLDPFLLKERIRLKLQHILKFIR